MFFLRPEKFSKRFPSGGGSVRFLKDAFGHSKEQKICNFEDVSPLDFSNFLQWIFSFSPGFLRKLVSTSPQKWSKPPDFWAEEKSAQSCDVSGCHVF